MSIFVLGTVLAWMGPLAAFSKPLVVLDAAHGGSDKGVVAGENIEKDWNLKFAKVLARAFEASGFDVVMVRNRDETISPEKRIEIANTSKASVVIVLHSDREWTGVQKGPLIVVEPPNRNEGGEPADLQRWGTLSSSQYRTSLKLARALAQKLGFGPAFSNLSDSRGLLSEPSSAEGRILCGPHQSLRYLTPPAVVLTPLFLTSASDLKKFSQETALQDFAQRTVRGTMDFLQMTME